MDMDFFKPKRVALYARVSKEELAEQEYSIEAQTVLLTEAVVEAGNKVVRVFIDTEVSGMSTTGRAALAEMLKEAKENKFDIVLTRNINRLAQDQATFVRIVDELSLHGVAFRSATENFETETNIGRFVLNVMRTIGELDWAIPADSNKMSMLGQASR